MVGTAQRALDVVNRILVVGAGGMLGRDVLSTLGDYDVTGLTRSELDITDVSAVETAVLGFDVVINTAAFTAVDDAETQQALAFAINEGGPKNLARACHLEGSTLIHLSTDYVFDGTTEVPYAENSPANPQSVYGASKYAGEQAVLEECPEHSIILRTSWLYGEHGSCFPRAILRAGSEKDQLTVVDDQHGQPTWTIDVARMIQNLVDHQISAGIFHATNSGVTTWHGFARKLFELAGWDPERVSRATTDAYPRPAPRPAWSVLGHENWSAQGLSSPRNWEVALEEAWSNGLSNFARRDGAL